MPRKVGGNLEVFIHTKARSMKSVESVVSSVAELGGRVLHAYPPRVIVALVPTDQVDALAGKRYVSAVYTDPIKPSQIKAAASTSHTQQAMDAWNRHFDLERRMLSMAGPELDKDWDEEGKVDLEPPPEVRERLVERELKMFPLRAAPEVEGAPNMNIPILVGRIGVGVIYVDSTVAKYTITDAEKGKVLSETIEGLNMLSGFEPRANIQWFYDFQRVKLTLDDGDLPSQDHEDAWRNAAMAKLGYSANLAGMQAYINDIKTKYNAQWAYAIYVTKYPKYHFAYYWGNHVVMDFTVDGWGIDNFDRVVAHETGHVFGCPDEYASSNCSCAKRYGRYQVLNGNCIICAANFIPCLMCSNTPAVCDYTRGHLGWNNLAVKTQGTTTLKGTWTFDFDNGVQGPPAGADVWWEQVNNEIRFMVPENGAMLAHMGKPDFEAVSYQALQSQNYAANPINGSNNNQNKLTAGTVLAIKTSSGSYCKMKVNTYGYNLGITWVTYL